MQNEFRETLQPIINDMFAVDIYFITRFCEIARFVNSLLVAIYRLNFWFHILQVRCKNRKLLVLQFRYDVSLRYMVSDIANIINVIFTIIHNFQ